jgi:hypothetical protein
MPDMRVGLGMNSFTAMLDPRNSTARMRTRGLSPAFATEYAREPAVFARPMPDPIATNDPPPPGQSVGIEVFAVFQAPVKSISRAPRSPGA